MLPGLIPLAAGGAVLGAGASAGGAALEDNPYSDPEMAALRGGAVGAGMAGAAFGLSRLPPWAFVPVGIAALGGLYANHRANNPEPEAPRYDFQSLMREQS
jgi:hypothetical protein